MHDIGCLGLVHWDTPEGWYMEGSGRGFQDGEHVYTCGGFMLESVLPTFSSRSFIVSDLTFRFLIHFFFSFLFYKF